MPGSKMVQQTRLGVTRVHSARGKQCVLGGIRQHVEHAACRFIMTNVLPAGRNGAAHDAVCVEVLKTSAGLGLSLDGGKSSVSGDGPLLIKRVYKGKVYLHGNPSLLCEDRTASKACSAFYNNELYCACI